MICRLTGVECSRAGSRCPEALGGRAAGKSNTADGADITETGRLTGAGADACPEICPTCHTPDTDVIARSVNLRSGTSFLGGIKSAICSYFLLNVSCYQNHPHVPTPYTEAECQKKSLQL